MVQPNNKLTNAFFKINKSKTVNNSFSIVTGGKTVK